MKIIRKIEKIFGVTSLDSNLLKLYQNCNGNSINEFVCDCDVIYDLKKLL
jgi:hypothetical protein